MLRYDYFETPVTINGEDYIAKFDVEVHPDVNNFRTHQVIKIDLARPEGRLARQSHAPASGEPGPAEGTSSLNIVSSIAQGANSVKPGDDGLGGGGPGINSFYFSELSRSLAAALQQGNTKIATDSLDGVWEELSASRGAVNGSGRGLRETQAAGKGTDTARARSASFYLPDKLEKDIPAPGERETAPETGAAVNENGLISLTELEKTNLSSGKKNKIVSTFQEAVGFIRNALADRQNVDRAYLGKVPQATAERVLRETGIDISGYNAILSGDAVRHMFNHHGDEAAEAARGQVALTPETAARIPEILTNPDHIALSGSKRAAYAYF